MRARIVIPVAVVAVVLLGVGVAVAAIGGGDAPTRLQRSLQAKVENSAGAPRAGHDPAKARQTSLSSAARKPNEGAGRDTRRPARGVKLRKQRRSPSSVLSDAPGEVLGGCLAGYGRPGEHCLPARAPGDKKLTCAYAGKLFPHGIAVTGRDRLKLDTNRDGLACGPGDRRSAGR